MEQTKIFEYLKNNPNTTYNEALCMIDALKEDSPLVKIDFDKKAEELNKENVYTALVNIGNGDLEFYHYHNFEADHKMGIDFLTCNITKIKIGVRGCLIVEKENQEYNEEEIFHYTLDVLNLSKEKFEVIKNNTIKHSTGVSEILYNEIFKK